MVPRPAGFVVALSVVIAGAPGRRTDAASTFRRADAAGYLASARVRSGAPRLRSGVARRRWAAAGGTLHRGWLRRTSGSPMKRGRAAIAGGLTKPGGTSN